MLHCFAYCIYEGTVRGEMPWGNVWGELSGGDIPRRNDQGDTSEREIIT